MIFSSQNTVPYWEARGPVVVNAYVQPQREPNFEPPASLKMLEGQILSYDLARRIKQLLTLLAALARFTRWVMTEIRRWLHAALATPPVPARESVGRVCSLGSAYRVRGPPRLLT